MMMKKILLKLICGLFVLMFASLNTQAQFTGGIGAGYDAETGFGNVITGESLGPLFAGGSGAGHATNNYETPSFELTGTQGFRTLSAPAGIQLSAFLDPVWTQGAVGANVENGSPNVFKWDLEKDGGADWQGITDLNTTVPEGTGILVYVYDDDNFDGEPDSFPKSLNTYFGGFSAGSLAPEINSESEGFTLLGNPYPKAISFPSLDISDLAEVAYIWDPGDNEWKSYSSGNGVGGITDGIIAPFQGFMVENTTDPDSPSISFSPDHQTTGGEFFGKESNEKDYLQFKVSTGTETNSAWLIISESGSDQRLRSDALKLEPLSDDYLAISFNKGDIPLDIANFQIPGAEDEFMVDIKSSFSGIHTITIPDFNFNSNLELYFIDTEDGVELELDENFSYQFEIEPVQQSKKVQDGKVEKPSLIRSKNILDTNPRFRIVAKEGIDNKEDLPTVVNLAQNYPNPFNPVTVIGYQLPVTSDVTLEVFDMLGRRVATLVNEQIEAGVHEVTFNASHLASGVYIYRLQAGNSVFTKKLTLIK